MGRFDAWVRAVGSEPDPRFTLANERTFLSWMTTALGLLGVGLALGTILDAATTGARVLAALWILMAALVAVRALVRWIRLERAMRAGEALPLSSSIPIVAVALAVLSLASGVVVLAAG